MPGPDSGFGSLALNLCTSCRALQTKFLLVQAKAPEVNVMMSTTNVRRHSNSWETGSTAKAKWNSRERLNVPAGQACHSIATRPEAHPLSLTTPGSTASWRGLASDANNIFTAPSPSQDDGYQPPGGVKEEWLSTRTPLSVPSVGFGVRTDGHEVETGTMEALFALALVPRRDIPSCSSPSAVLFEPW